MKKAIGFLLIITLMLSMSTVSFASSNIDGFSHQTGTWDNLTGISATPSNATQHLLIEGEASEGSFEVTLSGDFLGQSSENGIYIKGSKLDEVTETGVWNGKHIESGTDEGGVSGLSYYMIYLAVDTITLINCYNGEFNWSTNVRADVTAKLGDSGAWKNDNKVVIKTEFGTNGSVKIYVEGTLMIDYTPAAGVSYPTGDQIALRATNPKNAWSKENPAPDPETVVFSNMKMKNSAGTELSTTCVHQTGTWTDNNGGVSAIPSNATQHLLLEDKASEGSFEVTLSGDFLGQSSNNGIYIKGSKLDEVTETGVWEGKHIESGTDEDGVSGLSYYMIYFNGDTITLINSYNGKFNWDTNVRADVTAKLGDSGAWKDDNKVVLKTEFGTNGSVKIYVEGTLMIDYTPAAGVSYPTGDQIALRACNLDNAWSKENPTPDPETVVFTGFKVTGASSVETGDNSMNAVVGAAVVFVCTLAVTVAVRKRKFA